MIPPCDPDILENNPQFRKLYQQLTTAVLNADGSTRANDEQPDRKAVLEELRSCQVRRAAKRIKRQTLRQLAFDVDSGLPDDYRDPVAVIILYLESSPEQLDGDHKDDHDGAQALSLLSSDVDAFYSIIPALVLPFSNALSSAVEDLRAIANVGRSPDCAPSVPSSAASHTSTVTTRARARTKFNKPKAKAQAPLASQLRERIQTLRQMQLAELPAARTKMATTAAEVLATRAEILEQTVVLLERAKHGALSRATKAKAEHLSMVAQGAEAKLSIMKYDIAGTIYTPEVIAALTRYRQHLQETRKRLEEKEKRTLAELEAYEGVDSAGIDSSRPSRGIQHFESGPMKEIARRYGSLIKEIEAVKLEIRRLNG
ncbi:uncharacterized protein ACLA_049730 [Aspergillus clavatus NRRL 1]|uniref:Uncharacterized protein n=1 Tax=Aspergillus clavatus (strain ATCC 1007 / CBS 513.65 / DSM 816 / NCTC 3887 / NRRL 1 / QM 1276 / 107) TaxID=344612 RepID=A1CHZ6_ASPCL|nr:uncharacterized protein ACLA_049730 [Aspergillus clavatus NRRL 1]EAW10501.1 conserved hypothetical protein [Aspergillus clavatus NRRL 1]